MTTNNLDKSTAFWWLVVGSIWFAVFRALGDIGGGSGLTRTPYRDPANVTVEQVTEERKIAAQNRFCSLPLKSGYVRLLNNICFIYGEEGHPAGAPLYNFPGKDPSGKLQTVELSDVLSFSIVDYREDECLVKINVFPSISVTELLRQKPSYSDLKLRYTREVQLWVKTKSADGPLLVCEIKHDGSRSVACLFNDIRAQIMIELYGSEHIWYAIQSVIADSDYPYQHIITSQ